MSFLIDHYGIIKLKDFIAGSEFDDSRDNISNEFLATYGIAIEIVWN